MEDLYALAKACLDARTVDRKLVLTGEAVAAWSQGLVSRDQALGAEPIGEAGRPEQPELVPPRRLRRRPKGTQEGRIALIHALAHIEFNAVNLAWDAVYRFRGLPRAYYADWVRIAGEEAYHFRLLRGRLRDLGSDYGSLPAHAGLWTMAVKTAADPMLRMALVPRVLEARGLDVTPGMIDRLRAENDGTTADILEIILADEIGHVAAGTHWFRYLCGARGLDPEATFFELVERHFEGRLRGPFHQAARRKAGFTSNELARLARIELR